MSEDSALRKSLKELDCFAPLDDAALGLLEEKMRIRSYIEGDVICEENDPGDWMFIVSSGKVRVLKEQTDTAPIQVAVLEQGDFGGIQSLFEKRTRSATLLAGTDVKLWVLSHRAFRRLIEEHSGMAMAMMAFMSKRMRKDSSNLAMTLQYVGDSQLAKIYERCTPRERLILDAIVAKIMAAESLEMVMDFLFDSLRRFSPCNRLSLAFLEENGQRVVSHWLRADYEPLLLDNSYAADLKGSSLEEVLRSQQPRVIDDIAEYAREHPDSVTPPLLAREGIRSTMACPLIVEDRPVGFLFRGAVEPGAYDEHQVLLHLAIADRLSQAVEKAYRIEQLTAANQAYFEMLGFVSHELKSPIASIVMNADVLLGGFLGELQPEQRNLLERMVYKSRYLLDLIGEYLNLARLESSNSEPDMRAGVDFIDDIVETAIDIVLPQIEARKMTLTRDWKEEVILIECVPDLLQIVMVNLLSNAVKYGNEEGAIRVSISCENDVVSWAYQQHLLRR